MIVVQREREPTEAEKVILAAYAEAAVTDGPPHVSMPTSNDPPISPDDVTLAGRLRQPDYGDKVCRATVQIYREVRGKLFKTRLRAVLRLHKEENRKKFFENLRDMLSQGSQWCKYSWRLLRRDYRL